MLLPFAVGVCLKSVVSLSLFFILIRLYGKDLNLTNERGKW